MKKGMTNLDKYVIFGGLFLLLVISLMMVVASNSVAAEPEVSSVTVSGGNDILGLFKFDIAEKWNLWLKGAKAMGECVPNAGFIGPSATSTPCSAHKSETTCKKDDTCTWSQQTDKIAELMKYYILILMIIIVYSVFTSMNFPEGGFLRFILAVVTGFLATFLISTNELLSLAQSYGALGLAVTTFFPIIVLAGLTIVVATSTNPIGIFTSKILWLAYALFLFFRTGLLWLASLFVVYDPVKNELTGKVPGLIAPFIGTIRVPVAETTDAAGKIIPAHFVTKLTAAGEQKLMDMLSNYDPATMFVLGIIAVAVIWFMVIKDAWLYAFIDKMKTEAAIAKQKSLLEKSQQLRKAEAETVDETGKKV